MSSQLNQRALEMLRQTENELVNIKSQYNELLEAFNHNLDIVKERDDELKIQDHQLAQLKQLVSEHKSIDFIQDKLTSQEHIAKQHRDECKSLRLELQKALKDLSEQILISDQNTSELQNQTQKSKQLQFMLDKTQAEAKTYQIKLSEKENQQLNLASKTVQATTELQVKIQTIENLEQRLEELQKMYSVQSKKHNDYETQIFDLKQDNQRLSLEYIKLKETLEKSSKQHTSDKEAMELIYNQQKDKIKLTKQHHKQLEKQCQSLEKNTHKLTCELAQNQSILAQKSENYEIILAKNEEQITSLTSQLRQKDDLIRQLDYKYVEQINSKQADLNYKSAQNNKFQVEFDEKIRQLTLNLNSEKTKNSQLFAQIKDLQQANFSAKNDGNYKEIIRQMRSEMEKATLKIAEIEAENQKLRSGKSNSNSKISQLETELQTLKSEKFEIQHKLEMESQQNLINFANAANPGQIDIIEKLKNKLKEAVESLRKLVGQNENLEKEVVIYREKYQMVMNMNDTVQYRPRGEGVDVQSVQVQNGYKGNYGEENVTYSPICGGNQLAPAINLDSNQLTTEEFPSRLTFDESLNQGIQDILRNAGVK